MHIAICERRSSMYITCSNCACCYLGHPLPWSCEMFRKLRLGFDAVPAPKIRHCIAHWLLVFVLPAYTSRPWHVWFELFNTSSLLFLRRLVMGFLHVSYHLCCWPVYSTFSLLLSASLVAVAFESLVGFESMRGSCDSIAVGGVETKSSFGDGFSDILFCKNHHINSVDVLLLSSVMVYSVVI